MAAAATASLLKASSFCFHRDSKHLPLKWRRNPVLLQRSTQIPLLLLPSIKKTTTSFSTMQCVMNNNSKNCFMEEEEEDDDDDQEEKRKRNQNPLNKRFAEVMMMLGGVMFLAYDPYSSAIAASGGRMGGQSFSSSSSPSYSSSSSYSSSPSYSDDSSYSSSPSYSSSSSSSDDFFSSSSSSPSSYSSSPSYSSSSSSSGDFSSSDDSSSSSPSFSFSVSSPTSTHSMDKSCSISEWWLLFGLIIVIIAGIVIKVYEYQESHRWRDRWREGSTWYEGSTLTNAQTTTVLKLRSEGSTLTNGQTTTVLKLQVGLMGKKRLLQRNLDRIAETADTSTNKGLSNILRETTLLLLKHPDCCISGYSSVNVKQSIEDGEKLFNRVCIEERAKFDEETLVNVDNSKRQNTTSKEADGVSNEYIVITILVAAKGVHKLPAINGSADLKDALQKLGSISSNKTMAALEVLWTPQEENDTLTEQELHEDYPLLRPFDKDQDTQPLEKC